MCDFSPMTPGKGIAVRFGVNKGNVDALKSPHLPPVTSPSAAASANKSSFYKKSKETGSSSMGVGESDTTKTGSELAVVEES